MKPRLETDSKTGRKTLYVYYDNELADYDQAIAEAERWFGVKDDPGVSVIVLPDSMAPGAGKSLNFFVV